jgi:hypothetical protein
VGGRWRGGVHQILHDFVLTLDVDRFAAGQFGQWDQMALAAEADVDVVMAQALFAQAIATPIAVMRSAVN